MVSVRRWVPRRDADIMINVREGHCVCDADSSLVFLSKNDVRWLFIDTDPKAFKLRLDDLLIRQRFVNVQDNEDQVACLCHGYNLTTSALAIFSPLDDTR